MGTSSSVKRIILSTIFITVEFPFGLFHSVFVFFFEEPLSPWDLSFPTRDGTLCPAVKLGVLTTGHQGSPIHIIVLCHGCSFLFKYIPVVNHYIISSPLGKFLGFTFHHSYYYQPNPSFNFPYLAILQKPL